MQDDNLHTDEINQVDFESIVYYTESQCSIQVRSKKLDNKLHDVIRKVEALLRVAQDSSATDNERENAQRFAQQIMTKYQIEEAHLHKGSPTTIVRREIPIDSYYFLDKVILLDCIANENFCRVLRGKDYAVIYGCESDIELVISMFQNLLLDMVLSMSKKLQELELHGPVRNITSWKKSFFSGYAVGVRDRLRSTRNKVQEESSSALALIDKEHLISNFWNELDPQGPRTRAFSNADAFHEGRSSGSNVDVGQEKLSKE